ncbi:hypothetical protein [Kiloniella sp. b19]|uniref:hypothetical protein n=1 Tax=Kiloniella sp. GXU_MW_B19 TaxID=3141326 RepID=UPI0031DA9879
MMILRYTGLLFLLLAAASLAFDGISFLQGQPFHLSLFGELWFRIHPFSLNLSQAVVERYITPSLWDGIITPVLLFPFVAVFGIFGSILYMLGRLKRV